MLNAIVCKRLKGNSKLPTLTQLPPENLFLTLKLKINQVLVFAKVRNFMSFFEIENRNLGPALLKYRNPEDRSLHTQ